MNYKAWSAKLTEHFFNADGAGRPAYLRVDPDELAIILGSDDPDSARADFTKAIQEAVRGDGTLKRLEELPDFPLWFLLKELRKDEGQHPPFVGLLAASVLAGFDMANDPKAGLSAGAYYPPARQNPHRTWYPQRRALPAAPLVAAAKQVAR